MPYSLSRQARDDIRELYLFGANEYGQRQAEHYLDGLYAVFELVAEFPGMGRDIGDGIRVLAYRAHVAVYVVLDAGEVRITRIENARSDWQNHILSKR